MKSKWVPPDPTSPVLRTTKNPRYLYDYIKLCYKPHNRHFYHWDDKLIKSVNKTIYARFSYVYDDGLIVGQYIHVKDLSREDVIFLIWMVLSWVEPHRLTRLKLLGSRGAEDGWTARQRLTIGENVTVGPVKRRLALAARTTKEHIPYYFPLWNDIVKRAKTLGVWSTVEHLWKPIYDAHDQIRGLSGGGTAEEKEKEAGRPPKRPPKSRSGRRVPKGNTQKAGRKKAVKK